MCRSLVSLLCFLGCAAACSSVLPRSLDDPAKQYVRLAVALGERDPDSLDFYSGPADAVADIRRSPPPLAGIKRDAQRLMAQLGERHDPDPVDETRVRALEADLAAIAARVDLLTGARLPFNQESEALFGVTPGPVDDSGFDATRSRISAIVGGTGRLVDRYAAFAARFIVPPDRLRPMMDAALAACRDATLAHVALPPGEQVQLEFVRNKPWAAYSRYLGGGRSLIQINADFRFTADQVLQVACHEGYPGHHARNVQRAAGVEGRWPERSVQLTFSPESLQSEASAMLAADSAFSPDERLRIERDRLFPIAGLPPQDAAAHIEVEALVGGLQTVQVDVARRYLDGELEFARAVRELEERALVPHAEALVKYINEFRSYVIAYTQGRRR